MIASMTGFGRGVAEGPDGRRFRLEMRAVNHRFAEVVCRLPREYAAIEDGLRRLVLSEVKRGRVEVLFASEEGAAPESAVRVDVPLARAYYKGLKDLAAAVGADAAPDLALLAGLPGVLAASRPEVDAERDWPAIAAAAEQALAGLAAMRRAEGERLREDLLGKLDELESVAAAVAVREPAARSAFAERLRRRLDEWLQPAEVDPARLAQEVAMLGERSAIDEEIVRLRSHLAEMRQTLGTDGDDGIGRRCDFIVQEMVRELNTIGSKAQDVEITRAVLDGKGLCEKVREQVQNLQ